MLPLLRLCSYVAAAEQLLLFSLNSLLNTRSRSVHIAQYPAIQLLQLLRQQDAPSKQLLHMRNAAAIQLWQLLRLRNAAAIQPSQLLRLRNAAATQLWQLLRLRNAAAIQPSQMFRMRNAAAKQLLQLSCRIFASRCSSMDTNLYSCWTCAPRAGAG